MSEDELVRLFFYLMFGSFVSSASGWWFGYQYGRRRK